MSLTPHSAIRTPQLSPIITALEKSRRPLLTSHIRLDGDAIGSELALAHILTARGITPHIVNDSAVPKIYAFLPGADKIAVTPDALRNDYDLVVCLDIPQRTRAGKIFQHLPSNIVVISIDHHPFIEPVGEPEWRDTSISSTGEMIYNLAVSAGRQISAQAATCLYVAILTDTGQFAFPNTTPATMRCVARLMELGADTVDIAERIYQNEPPNVLALRAETIQSLTLHADNRIAVMTVTRDMLARLCVKPIDIHTFSDIPRSIAGVRIGVLLRESEKGVKVSLRSNPGINVAQIARQFDGGGHPQASGCEIHCGLAEAKQKIIEALRKELNRS